ncbi:hypothetical protein [Bradyrhizobium sp. BRP56]|uniref:hypothetical protein n=1 Tax=Bradyrhizobium sp. BRP56 TaxID=2793819 RepID=UPI00201BAA9F|nr:hypothetical protein [Bradyrhizobium sp. BRP56]
MILEALACGVVVGLIAENTIHVFGDKHVKAVFFKRMHHRLEARPVRGRRSGDCAIFEHRYYRPALALADVPTERDLIVNRSIVLIIRRVPGVDRSTKHLVQLPGREALQLGLVILASRVSS